MDGREQLITDAWNTLALADDGARLADAIDERSRLTDAVIAAVRTQKFGWSPLLRLVDNPACPPQVLQELLVEYADDGEICETITYNPACPYPLVLGNAERTIRHADVDAKTIASLAGTLIVKGRRFSPFRAADELLGHPYLPATVKAQVLARGHLYACDRLLRNPTLTYAEACRIFESFDRYGGTALAHGEMQYAFNPKADPHWLHQHLLPRTDYTAKVALVNPNLASDDVAHAVRNEGAGAKPSDTTNVLLSRDDLPSDFVFALARAHGRYNGPAHSLHLALHPHADERILDVTLADAGDPFDNILIVERWARDLKEVELMLRLINNVGAVTLSELRNVCDALRYQS